MNSQQNSKEKIIKLIDDHLQVYNTEGNRLYKMNDLKKETGLKAKEIKNIVMEYYNELYKGNRDQTPKLMYDLTFGKIKTSYKMLEKLCDKNGFDLVTKESDWFKLLQENGKAPYNIKFQVRCRSEEKHVTTKTIDLVRNHGCRYCNGKYINQRRTIAIVEDIFGKNIDEIKEEAYLAEIIADIETNPSYDEYRDKMDVFRLRVDLFIKLNIKDKNGKEIKLTIEAQGDQHKNNAKGLKTWLYLNKFKGQEFDEEWHNLKAEWEISLLRDELKINEFKNNKDEGYYLITVDNNIKIKNRANHILEKLYEQAGVDLRYLSANVKINEILKRIL